MRALVLWSALGLLVAVTATAGVYVWHRHLGPVPTEIALPSPGPVEPRPPPDDIVPPTEFEPPPVSIPPYAELEFPPLPPPDLPQRRYTLAEKLEEIGPAARPRLVAKFEAAGVKWPPREVTLLALKDENVLELHARRLGKPWQLVHRYPIQKASGLPGPKLLQGDHQVPEGIYRVIFLNPNSRYHVSLRLDYPNAFDQQMGAKDGRTMLGGDIMIHGKALSVGCLAMGDEAAEDLFVLAAAVLPRGKSVPRMRVIIAPTDFRKTAPAKPHPAGAPPWLDQLYADISREMATFKGQL